MNEVLVTSGEPRTTGDPTSQSFGRFRILRTLAFGGMAQILLAVDRNDRKVVLKRILPHYAQNPEFVQFFIHEGRLGSRLRHKNLVQTIEAGQVGSVCYIALEYLRGQPAIELLRAAARAKVDVPLGVAVRIVADAARGLHHAHMATDLEGQPLNVIHRDVTPHNLFVCTDGSTKVLDFGIAKAASQLHHTRTGTIKGKFAYLSPEQIKGEGIDRRVDVFALGIVLHELLTLKPLFRGANDGETLQKVLTLEVQPPESIRRGVPPGLGAVALRALQRDRERRLPSAEALADSIEAVAAAYDIDASQEAVARLLHRLFPDSEELADEAAYAGGETLGGEGAVSLEETPPKGVPECDPPVAVDEHELPTRPVPAAMRAALADLASSHTRALARRRTGRAAALVASASILLALALTTTTCFDRLARRPIAVEPPSVQAADPLPPRGPAREARPAAAPALLPAAMIAAPAPVEEATLRVQTDGTASFVVDGKPQRVASDGTLHLQPGRHTVVVSASGLAFPRTLSVDLKANESALRSVHGGRGQLRIAVTPWAEVLVDGRALGVTPLSPQELSEGTHLVTLRNAELSVTTKRRVVISPNKESLLKVDLFGEKKAN